MSMGNRGAALAFLFGALLRDNLVFRETTHHIVFFLDRCGGSKSTEFGKSFVRGCYSEEKNPEGSFASETDTVDVFVLALGLEVSAWNGSWSVPSCGLDCGDGATRDTPAILILELFLLPRTSYGQLVISRIGSA